MGKDNQASQDSRVSAEAIMEDIKKSIRERIITSTSADADILREIDDTFRHAVSLENTDNLFLSRYMRYNEDWCIDKPFIHTSHRRFIGPVIVFIKKILITPLTRWLFLYTSERFKRQQRNNEILLAYAESLTIKHFELSQRVRELEKRLETFNKGPSEIMIEQERKDTP